MGKWAKDKLVFLKRTNGYSTLLRVYIMSNRRGKWRENVDLVFTHRVGKDWTDLLSTGRLEWEEGLPQIAEVGESLSCKFGLTSVYLSAVSSWQVFSLSLLIRALIPPDHFHDLTLSQRLHLLKPSPWGWGFNMWTLRENKHSVHSVQLKEASFLENN